MPKGLRQLLHERGLLVHGMSRTGGKSKDRLLSMEHVIEAQPDIAKQVSVVQMTMEEFTGTANQAGDVVRDAAAVLTAAACRVASASAAST